VTLLRLALAAFVALASPAVAAGEGPQHAIAMYGEPALAPGYDHLPGATPDARQGGRLVLGAQGTFDGLNPFVVKGVTAVQGITTLTIDTLMKRAPDEPFTLYGLVAQSIETPPDRSWVIFRLDPRARFSDGQPITAQDVVFTCNLLKEKGRPNYRNSLGKVKAITTPDKYTVRFDLAGADDRELPLILGLMPVLPKHATDPATFGESGFKPLLGSGPYVVADVKPGQSVTYRRNPTYWAADLPANRGMFHFDEIRYDYYRDANSLFEAFKAGLYDVRIEEDPTRWVSGYDIPAVREGRIVREAAPLRLPKGMYGFVFNTRRPLFADPRVREALGYLFDFEWVNRNLFGGVYTRSDSYFAGSELSSAGRPADARERALLAPFPDAVRPDILAGEWHPPSSDGSGRDRDQARKALALLKKAGWSIEGEELKRDGQSFTFEIMVTARDQERLALNFADSLARIGVTANVRLVDSVQYQRRRQRFDYDMILASWPVSASPGNEQFFRWGSKAAEREGSFNFAGASSPAIDAMIDAMLASRTHEEFVDGVRALDRVLLSGFYVVPLFYVNDQWIARAVAIGRPKELPLFGAMPETWWRKRP
jgi:peptide/nickel transport system substrate-binding protein